jgi:type VI secretion system protein ImpA
MALIEFAAMSAAISDVEPCGPDLDLAGDAEYMHVVARAEGLMPASFFSGPEGAPFDRSSIDFSAELAAIAPLIARSRDLRLLTIVTKFMCLTRDLAGVAGALGAVAELLDRRWDHVHPGGEAGDYALRMATLASLDDLPTVVIPLQYLPLASHRRLGVISYRSWAIAGGEVKPRDGEAALDASVLHQALAEVDLAGLVETRGHFLTIQSALAGLGRLCVDRAGPAQAVALDKLPVLVTKILKLLDDALVARDPSLAIKAGPASGATDADAPHEAAIEGSEAAVMPRAAIASAADAIAALDAVAGYFSRNEPSSPALLLVRQAQQLLGKSFLEVMQALVPAHVEKATFPIGRDSVFRLPVERLSALGGAAAAPVLVAEPAIAALSESPPVATRQEARLLLEQIGSYYRLAEPSSPVSFLTERARSLSDRDFLSLLGDLLPAASFKEGALT